jgi:toxin ParE1/3/4
MRVVYTAEALADLDGILGFIAEHYPGIVNAFERRLRVAGPAHRRMAAECARGRRTPGRPCVPLLPYPYRLFYRVTADAVEILHIHHAARRVPWADER